MTRTLLTVLMLTVFAAYGADVASQEADERARRGQAPAERLTSRLQLEPMAKLRIWPRGRARGRRSGSSGSSGDSRGVTSRRRERLLPRAALAQHRRPTSGPERLALDGPSRHRARWSVLQHVFRSSFLMTAGFAGAGR